MAAAHFVDGRRRGGVAGHHQRFDVVLLTQVLGDGVGARSDKSVAALAIRALALSARYTKRSWGRAANSARSTLSPPTPLSNTPMGRSLRHREPSSGSGETGCRKTGACADTPASIRMLVRGEMKKSRPKANASR